MDSLSATLSSLLFFALTLRYGLDYFRVFVANPTDFTWRQKINAYTGGFPTVVRYGEPGMSWIAIGALAVVGVGIPLGMMAASALLRPSVPEQGKSATYESGEIPTGTARSFKFNIQYYMVALLFVVFDIETVLVFPWAVIYSDAVEVVGITRALGPMLLFIGILLIGLVWAWRNGAVSWTKSPRATRRKTERGDA